MIVPTIADHGFVAGIDASHSEVRPDLSPERFYEPAQNLLPSLGNSVMHHVVPRLDEFEGKWHPIGFMVYALGIHPELGSLRLHIWPPGPRPESPRGPRIHDHGWYLASLALAGSYSDNIYSIGASTTVLGAASKELNVFTTSYSRNKPDRLVATGDQVTASATKNRVVSAGDMHTIDPGIFHLPSIETTTSAATLVIDSPSLGIQPKVLIEGDRSPIEEERVKVTPGQALIAKQYLNANHVN